MCMLMTRNSSVVFMVAALCIYIPGCTHTSSVRVGAPDFFKVEAEIPRMEVADDVKRATLVKAFNRYIGDFPREGALSATHDADLDLYLRIAQSMVFYTDMTSYAIQQKLILDENTRRQRTTAAQRLEYYESLIRVRDFKNAVDFAPQLQPPAEDVLPEMVDPLGRGFTGPSAWQLHPLLDIATRVPANLSADWQIVVVAHPRCGFSRRMMQHINADTTLSSEVKGRIQFVTPQDSQFNFETLRDWNHRYPDQALSVVHIASEWPFDQFSETPITYFLHKGIVQKKLVGWRNETHRDRFADAISELKRLPAK